MRGFVLRRLTETPNGVVGTLGKRPFVVCAGEEHAFNVGLAAGRPVRAAEHGQAPVGGKSGR